VKVTLTTQQRDEIARWKAEAVTCRAQAQRFDGLARAAKTRRDPLEELRWKSYAHENRVSAKRAVARIQEIRDQARMFAIQQRMAREARS
jgi:hypothetical protein